MREGQEFTWLLCDRARNFAAILHLLGAMFFSRRQENDHEGGIGHAEPSRHVLHPEACRHVNFHTKQHHVDPQNRKLVKKTGSSWEVQRNCDFGCLERSFDITQLWCLSVHSISFKISRICPRGPETRSATHAAPKGAREQSKPKWLLSKHQDE